MRLATLLVLATALAIAGCETPEAAYERPDDTIIMPGWAERSPSVAEIRRAYPQEALNEEVEARVMLLCTVQPTRDLACTVDSEGTPGYGFGEAALSVARLFRVKPAEPDAPTAPGRKVRVPIRFAVG